jgi:hypothetical protein
MWTECSVWQVGTVTGRESSVMRQRGTFQGPASSSPFASDLYLWPRNIHVDKSVVRAFLWNPKRTTDWFFCILMTDLGMTEHSLYEEINPTLDLSSMKPLCFADLIVNDGHRQLTERRLIYQQTN